MREEYIIMTSKKLIRLDVIYKLKKASDSIREIVD